MQILLPVTTVGYDGSHHLRYAKCFQPSTPFSLRIMLRSQIKRAQDGFIQLHRFKDFEKSSGHRNILRHFAHAVTNQRGSFFGNAVSALFSSERHRMAPGQTSVGDRTDIGQQPDGTRTDIVLTLAAYRDKPRSLSVTLPLAQPLKYHTIQG